MSESLLDQPATIFGAQCTNCENMLGDKEVAYNRLISEGYLPSEAMDKLGIVNFCCRSKILCSVVIPRGVNLRDPFAKNIYKHVNTKINPIAQEVPVLILLRRYNGKEYIETVTPAQIRPCNLEEYVPNKQSVKIIGPDKKDIKTRTRIIDTKYTTETFVEPDRRELFQLE